MTGESSTKAKPSPWVRAALWSVPCALWLLGGVAAIGGPFLVLHDWSGTDTEERVLMSLLLLAFLVVGAPVAYVRSVPPSSRGGWRALVLALPICLLALAGAAMVVLGQILRING